MCCSSWYFRSYSRLVSSGRTAQVLLRLGWCVCITLWTPPRAVVIFRAGNCSHTTSFHLLPAMCFVVSRLIWSGVRTLLTFAPLLQVADGAEVVILPSQDRLNYSGISTNSRTGGHRHNGSSGRWVDAVNYGFATGLLFIKRTRKFSTSYNDTHFLLCADS